MAASPYYKCSTPEHGYCASFKFAEDAAQFAATLESFDSVAEIMAQRDGGTINPQL